MWDACGHEWQEYTPLWDVTPCSFVHICRRFGGTRCYPLRCSHVQNREIPTTLSYSQMSLCEGCLSNGPRELGVKKPLKYLCILIFEDWSDSTFYTLVRFVPQRAQRAFVRQTNRLLLYRVIIAGFCTNRAEYSNTLYSRYRPGVAQRVPGN